MTSQLFGPRRSYLSERVRGTLPHREGVPYTKRSLQPGLSPPPQELSKWYIPVHKSMEPVAMLAHSPMMSR